MVNLPPEDFDVLFVVLLRRFNLDEMVLGHTEALQKLQQTLAGGEHLLPAGHGHRGVVENDDRHVGVLMGRSKQRCHPRVGERRIPDGAEHGMRPSLGRPERHTN